ncbi:hypothetical protein SDRG_12433 [Saprolegnia diclina VS20]|uniref:Solute carrier family 40 member n=1 Tax=Saprolegnia diclina (strain VS20) TaxID=1156394 RepID=T0PWK1_SAPDV|nr:hypothetical protein SDRG_12433 [Saprolegnia diclina VS20]EQC29889.1 hypothetical protein SDRG_12433 [Saprolegnia diclina VS20]|eukprot:XP_008616728.1 hypothetical protein SDRG_12433 [Saprolegnia diclina VS20]
MDATLRIGALLGAASLALLSVSGGCAVAPDDCPVPNEFVLPMAMVGAATLLPILYCVLAFRRDHRAASSEARALLSSPTSRLVDGKGVCVTARVHAYMYASHFMSAWGDRMWQFAIPLLFMEIFVNTLLPSAVFSLVVYVIGVAAVPSLGQWLDHTSRMTVLNVSIVVENACVLLSTGTLGCMLYLIHGAATLQWNWTWPLTLLFGCTIALGAVGQVFSDAQTLSLEKDWVVVIATETSTRLGDWNTTMRRIDLSCKLLAPAAFGILMDYAGSDPMTRATVGAAAVGVWNLMSAPLEYAMVRDVYALVPALANSSHIESAKPKATLSLRQYTSMWAAYAAHPTFLVSFAYCALYMTVLSGSGLNIAYLQWRGVALSLLGATSGLGALFGLLGTLLFPLLVQRIGSVERVAVVSVWLFWLTLLPVGASFLLFGQVQITDYVMIVAVLLSRAWLWSADLAETQIMQEWVEVQRRGTINAMQSATTKLFYIGMLLVSIAFADPHAFRTLVFVSLSAVLLAAIGFSTWFSTIGRFGPPVASTV